MHRDAGRDARTALSGHSGDALQPDPGAPLAASSCPPAIAYLVSAYPVLSESFVYREVRSLAEIGVRVVLVARVRATAGDGVDARSLPEPVFLSDTGVMRRVGDLLRQLCGGPAGVLTALRWFAHDLAVTPGLARRLKLLAQFLEGATLARHLAARDIRHLHVHFIHAPSQVAMYAAAIARIPHTITAHANDIYVQNALLREKGQRAACILTISEFNRAYLIRAGVPAEKVRVVRCILDFPVSTAEDRSRRVRERGGEELLVGSLGRLVTKKGFPTLVRAVSLLRQRGRRVRLEIAGDGPEGEALRALVAQLPLADEVTLLGALPQADVPAWMSRLDCFALACEPDPSGSVDGIPVVLMEAMALGIPVISTEISGIPELVKDGSSGLLVSPHDADALANAMERLMTDPALAARVVNGAGGMVDGEFSKAVNFRRLAAAFSGASGPAG